MKTYPLFAIAALIGMAGCTPYNASPAATYADYNCNQLAMENNLLNDQIQQASAKETTHQIVQLSMTALALANGDSYNATPDTNRTDELQARLDEVHREEIRKQCNL